MNKEKEIAHLNGRYLIIGAVIALVGTFSTVYFSERKSDETSKTKTEAGKPEKGTESENSKLETSHTNQKQTSGSRKNVLHESQEKLTDESVSSVEVIVTLKDDVSKDPIPDAVFSFDGFSTLLKTDKFGRITIPNTLIEKYGNYNSVRATIKKEGYQTEETNVALSESHSLFLNKIK